MKSLPVLICEETGINEDELKDCLTWMSKHFFPLEVQKICSPWIEQQILADQLKFAEIDRRKTENNGILLKQQIAMDIFPHLIGSLKKQKGSKIISEAISAYEHVQNDVSKWLLKVKKNIESEIIVKIFNQIIGKRRFRIIQWNS